MVSAHHVTLLPCELVALAECLRREPFHDNYLPGHDNYLAGSGRWQPHFGLSRLEEPTLSVGDAGDLGAG
jgi:hypothetical protein